MSNSQRALWMVLITSLAAPFFASLFAIALALGRPATDFLLPEAAGTPIGEIGVDVFAWSALPATVAALGLTPFVLQHGTCTWLQSAIAGVLAFTAGAVIFPFADHGGLPMLAFVAGLLAVGMRAMLVRGGILLDNPKA